jgi:tryptophanyl-tRNA synthetase (EC 6.1.1.2)
LPKPGFITKPSILHAKFLSGLKAYGSKMSTSDPDSTVWVTDSPKEVERKIMKHAFSGGRGNLEEHRRLGGNPDIDVSYQWLYYFFEPDDKKLEKIREDYKSGNLLTKELKQYLIDKINIFLREHQKRREAARKKVDNFIFSP